ncbi:MAG: DegT/DnrJ/EryC1/StrS family aminotransferase [Chitinivibrionales bacterium]|nr:DegT/DnrJ/EryC1/StrS family aminotransferase [Chitinivibrionales bacterium]
MIPLIKPYITQEVKDKVCAVLDSGYLTEGPVTQEFEQCVRDYIGCKHAIAVTSCTTGLELALRALGVGPGDEIIVPDYTYPATADVVSIVGATVVIVDIIRDTMLIDYAALEKAVTPRTKAIIPVSLFGNPLDYDRLKKIAAQHNLKIIEDAACALGASYQGAKVGNFADITVFSLHPRKFITTGEGGIIATNDSALAEWMGSYKHFGMGIAPDRLATQFERIGTNYKLSNVLAAIGFVQMRHINKLLNQRIKLSGAYCELLMGNAEIIIPQTTHNGIHSRQSFCVYVKDRDLIIKKMREAGVETQIGTYCLHKQKAFLRNDRCRIVGEMPESKYAFENCLTLPLFDELTEENQKYITANLLNQLKSN